MNKKGIDKMPVGVSNGEMVARLAFGCDFDNASAFEESRLAQWWRKQRWSVRARLALRRLSR
jgi:hypothetical protein